MEIDLKLIILCSLVSLSVANFEKHGPYKTGAGQATGGKPVTPKFKYSSIVSIQVGGEHKCGGTILDKHYIITAQHCDFFKEGADVKIVAGIHDLKSPGEEAQTVSFTEAMGHPVFSKQDYGDSPSPYDIQIVRVEPSFVFNAFVTPMNFPPWDFVVKKDFNISAVGVGWAGSGSTELMEFNTTLIKYDTCQRKVGWFKKPDMEKNSSWIITEAQVCTMAKEEADVICYGDTGGPLYIYSKDDDTYLQLGIISAWPACGSKDFPILYTNLLKVKEWIGAETLRCKPRDTDRRK